MNAVKKYLLSLVMVVVLCSSVLFSVNVEAATKHVLPQSAFNTLGAGGCVHLYFSYSRMQVLSRASGIYLGRYTGDNTGEWSMYAKNVKATKTVNNACSLYWTNVGTLYGRTLNCRVDITKVVFHHKKDSDMAFCGGYTTGFRFGSSRAVAGDYSDCSSKNWTTSTAKFTVTYADNGAVVPFNFLHGATDLDTGTVAAGNIEKVTWQSGYTGHYYVWANQKVIIDTSGSTISARCPEDGVNADSGYASAGPYMAYAETNNGSFTATYNVHGRAANGCSLMTINTTSPNPTKSVSKTTANYGDTVTWSINYTKGVWNGNTLSPLTSLVFTDTIPEGMEVTGYKLLNGGSDVSNYMAVSHNGQAYTFTVSPSLYSSTSFYNGGVLAVQITTNVKVASHDTQVRKNTGYVNPSGKGAVATNTVQVTIPPCLRKITTEVVNGTIHEGYPDAYIGNDYTIDYQPNIDHYLKYIEIDGEKLSASDIESNLEQYVFQNLRDDHHIKVVYAKNPVITLTKTIGEHWVWSKGKPGFNFKIMGTDYLGHDRIFYRTIGFLEGDGLSKSLQIKIPAGKWVFSEFNTNDWQFTGLSTSPSEKTSVDGKNTTVDTRDIDAASVEYKNSILSYKDYTENNKIINSLK